MAVLYLTVWEALSQVLFYPHSRGEGAETLLCYKGPYSQSYGFSSSHVQMWELDPKKGCMLKNWCFQPVMWEKTLESPLDREEIKPVNLMEINPEYSYEGLMLKLKLQYFGHLMRRTNSFRKDPDAGKDWRQEEKWMTEDEMVGWHHWLNGHEFEEAPEIGDGQGSLASLCCSPWDCKESDTTEWLNYTDAKTLKLEMTDCVCQ